MIRIRRNGGAGRYNSFWRNNDALVAGEMGPVTRVLWCALMLTIGALTMALLWVTTR